MSETNSTITEPERAARLRLHLTPGIGHGRFHELLREFGSAAGALAAPRPALSAVVGPALAAALGDEAAHATRLARAQHQRARLDARVMVFGDRDYPPRLRRLTPAPAALWVQGGAPAPPSIAIVGTRRASARGLRMARFLASEAVSLGRDVISGGAYGIDACAHEGALEAGGSTTVVLGSGLDRPYPERHRGLFARAAKAGAVISIFTPGSPPVRGGFLARNAVVAALSDALIVVEAGLRSGAHSTAAHARRIGIPVSAVPGSPGTDELLSRGAVVITAPEELQPAPPLHGTDRAVLVALRQAGRVGAATLAAKLDLDVARVVVSLTALTLDGRVRPCAGGEFEAVAQRVIAGDRNSFGY